jgi:acyl carrier protein
MYKTGDLGRWLADGNIEYLGRNDFQVKIRGFRIELGEIEARLAACDGVREAVVVARQDELGHTHLVAYLVRNAAEDIVAADLRTELLTRLPDYMVPSGFVVLDALPLTPNGKLDRRALPSPEGGLRAQRPYRAPETEVEIELADMLEQLLGVERIGLDDDFFALGGHSLLATTLSVRVREHFHVDLSLKSVFEDARVVSIARAIEAAQMELLSEQDISSVQAELEALSDEELQAYMGNTIQ